jgi:hypothetical protein
MANVVLWSQLGYRPLVWRVIACYVLARWIEEHGYTCQVIEFTHLYSPEELVEATKMFIDKDTLMIGASTTMWSNWKADLQMQSHRGTTVPENITYAIKELKQEFPNIATVVGGPRAYDHFPGIELFDYATPIAFGEDWLLNLLDELSDKTMGVKLRRPKFDICTHRFVYREHDCILPGETLPIEWGRGCIFKCPFCRSPNLGKRPGTSEKNVDLMVDEFTEMYERFGTTSYYFIDETFNADVDRIENLAKVYNKLPFKLEFLCYNRADLLDKNPHTQDILHECGQRGTLMGIETFHPEAAKLIKKPWSAKRGKDFLLELQDKWPNTHIDCSMIVGIPGVPREFYFETAEWFLNTRLGFYVFKPLYMTHHERQGEWELNQEELGITFPDPVNEPDYWVWKDSSSLTTHKLTAELNRYLDVHDRWFMWSLGTVTAMGINLSDVVNKPASEIVKLTGDLYDQETRLFNLYKEKLKTFAGR